MAETTIPVATVSMAGLADNLVAANVDGSKFLCSTSQDTYLDVNNGGVGSINVTVLKQQSAAQVPGYGPVALVDFVVAVANGVRKQIGPIPPACIDTDGFAHVTFSGVTSVTVQAKKLARAAS